METEKRSSLGHIPDGAWKFDEKVATVFDDMLERSIPDYKTMRDLVFSLGRGFCHYGQTIIDIGCSRGEALAPFVEANGHGNRYVGVEISEPMRLEAEARFADKVKFGVDIRILPIDLRTSYPSTGGSCLTLSILTLMFVPIEHRANLLKRIAANLNPGGALLIVEKVLGMNAITDGIFVERYLKMKAQNGYTREEIDRKKLSLEGVLVPVTEQWNRDMLKAAGFEYVECFWRWCNFAGWIAIKP